MKREFVDIKPFYPNYPIDAGEYVIFKRTLTEEDKRQISYSNGIGSLFLEHFEVGKEHIILAIKDGETMMSDHPSEIITNQDFIDNAKGDVLIFGLGMGLIVFPLLNSDEINSITIVEKDKGLIDIVGPIIKEKDLKDKLRIKEGDAFLFFKEINTKFDTIYFDIWAKINNKSFDEMETLHKLYNRFLREDGYLDSWCYYLKNKLYKNDD